MFVFSFKGCAFAGLQYTSECFCGNAYGGQRPSLSCTMACGGDSTALCGGDCANNILATTTNRKFGYTANYYI